MQQRTAGRKAQREANRGAAAKIAKVNSMKGERKAQRWKATRVEAKRRMKVEGGARAPRTVARFLGQEVWGFKASHEPMLLKKRGKEMKAPEHWTKEEVEQQRSHHHRDQ